MREVTPFVFANRTAFVVAFVVIGAYLVLDLLTVQTRTNLRAGRDRGTFGLIQVTQFVGLALAVAAAWFVPATAIAGSRWWPVLAGAALTLAGTLLRQWAIRTLGRFFTPQIQISSEQRVVTGGPYRFVRHPSYTAVLLAYLGIGLILGNWLSAACLLVVPAVGYVRRISVEEAELSAALGDAYRTYARGRRRLVPGMW
jgi:protein-S-isoprenylcysteine O-methyltransferase Ste14